MFVGASLPGAVRFGEVNAEVELMCEVLVVCELFSVVEGECPPQSCGQILQARLDLTSHAASFPIADLGRQQITTLSFDERDHGSRLPRADDRISFPITKTPPIVHDLRPPFDRDLVRDAAAAIAAWIAGSSSTQEARKMSAIIRRLGIDPRVNGLMRDLTTVIMRKFGLRPTSDLIR